jgi:hypothetical protein
MAAHKKEFLRVLHTMPCCPQKKMKRVVVRVEKCATFFQMNRNRLPFHLRQPHSPSYPYSLLLLLLREISYRTEFALFY